MTQSTWIETRSGRRFDVANPREEDVHIEDIAVALAHTCRFGGHALRWISVGWHSVVVHDVVAMLCDHRDTRLAALLHDAAEAYVGDMPRPLKLAFPNFVLAENKVQDIIHQKFGLQPSEEIRTLIRKVDNQALLEEARAYMATGGRGWELLDEGLTIPGAAFVPDCPRDFHEVAKQFLARFHAAFCPPEDTPGLPNRPPERCSTAPLHQEIATPDRKLPPNPAPRK